MRVAGSVGALALLAACGIDLAVDPNTQIVCRNNGDCPAGSACHPTANQCVLAQDIPSPEVVLVRPENGSVDVDLQPSILIAFSLPVDFEEVQAKTHLIPAGQTAPVPLDWDPPGVATTYSMRPSSRLATGVVHELRVEAGLTPISGAPSPAVFTSSFTTSPDADVTPPGPVTDLVVSIRDASEVELSYGLPADADLLGVLVVHALGANLDTAPTDGQPYFSGATLGNGEVGGSTVLGSFVDVLAAPGNYDFGVFAFDASHNYSPKARAPLVTATSLAWCPDETAIFSTTSPDSATQSVLLGTAPGLGLGASTYPPVPDPVGSTTVVPASEVTLGQTNYWRSAVRAGSSVTLGPEGSFTATRSAVPITFQPLDLQPGGEASFLFDPSGFGVYEVEVDTDPLLGMESWTAAGVQQTAPGVVRAVVAAPGSFRFRVRAVVPGCPGGTWTHSDEFRAGDGRFVRDPGSGDQDGRDPQNAMPSIAGALSMISTGGIIYVAGGTYNEVLTVNDRVAIDGGYSADFTARDPQQYPTVIANDAVVSIGVGVTGDLTLSGFTVVNTLSSGTGAVALRVFGAAYVAESTIEGPDGPDASTGLLCNGCSTVTLDGVGVSGGAAVTDSRAAHFLSGPTVVVTGSTFTGGSGQDSWGFSASIADLTIIGSTFYGGTAESATGFFGSSVTGSVTGSLFDGGDATGMSTQAIGADISSVPGAVTFEGNRVYGGVAAQSMGVRSFGGPLLANNLIHGGTATFGATGIDLNGSGTTVIVHNTIDAGTGAMQGGPLWANSSSHPVVLNNLFISVDTNGYVRLSGLAASFENNAFLPATVLFSDGTVSWMTVADVNNLDGTPIAGLPAMCTPGVDCETARFGGNVLGPVLAADLFVDRDGRDDVLRTMDDNDWTVLPANTAITRGGKDPSSTDCGTHETPVACGGVTTDYDGVARTCPAPGSDCVSIGAHEVD